LNSAALPQSRRDSSKAVCTVTSLAASARHSSTVRTLEPISSPASQQLVMKDSTRLRKTASDSGDVPPVSSSTSMSEWGNSSPRP